MLILGNKYVVSFFCLCIPVLCFASSAFHVDPIAPIILGVSTVLFFAVLGRYLARQVNQPPVLGELLIGILVGNLFYYLGFQLISVLREGPAVLEILAHVLNGSSLEQSVFLTLGSGKNAALITKLLQGPDSLNLIRVAQVVDIFSRYGVIFLIFLVGLESSVEDMAMRGVESMRVAVIGVMAPMILGFIVAKLTMPGLSLQTDLFIAATLGATSVGITARVLSDLNKTKTREAKVILGAAMLDDILGLIILAIVSSIIITGNVDARAIMKIIALAILFLSSTLLMGPMIVSAVTQVLHKMDITEAKLFVSFLFVMLMAWLATVVDLATIVGAFAAGIILHDGYFMHMEKGRKSYTIRELVAPLQSILAPLFFILIGIQVKIESFFDIKVIILAMGLLIAAILGKIISGYGASKDCNRIAIGLGMLPRGEVGIIFASIGKNLGVLSDQLFSAIVLMVIVTTLIAPPMLKKKFK